MFSSDKLNTVLRKITSLFSKTMKTGDSSSSIEHPLSLSSLHLGECVHKLVESAQCGFLFVPCTIEEELTNETFREKSLFS